MFGIASLDSSLPIKDRRSFAGFFIIQHVHNHHTFSRPDTFIHTIVLLSLVNYHSLIIIMRLSTASLIFAYVATIAVQALPVESGNELTLRSAEVDVVVARGLGDVDIESRDPKK